MPKKSEFKKITGAKHYETRKESEKWSFRRKSSDLDFQGRRQPCTHGRWQPWGRRPRAMVTGNHGPRSPATMGLLPLFRSPFGRCFSAVFQAFLLLFLLYFP
eukprot:TRINITY_DN16238_c0_g1_i1.p1 TRINITY_DN16238_c0_g1~~TRINITY_DN16238_c0_g1_i1.p1  ORF type:complete len:102 (-),score=2.03 TRINITY_DN16238_c0_g1_i1:83-388(-)